MSVQGMPPPYNIGSEQVQVKQVIITQLLRRGEGVEDDPIRIITQFWDMDGNFICEFDPTPNKKEKME